MGTAALGWRERHRVWRQGGHRVHRGWPRYDDVAPRLAVQGVEVMPYEIDVAAFGRDVADYRQDPIYPAGIKGDRIGSDATDLPLSPSSVDLAARRVDPPRVESDAVICASEGWDQVHGRFDEPAHFAARSVANPGPLRLTLDRVRNDEAVAPDCCPKFAAVFTRT